MRHLFLSLCSDSGIFPVPCTVLILDLFRVAAFACVYRGLLNRMYIRLEREGVLSRGPINSPVRAEADVIGLQTNLANEM